MSGPDGGQERDIFSVSDFPVPSRERQIGQASRRIRPTMKKVDNDHLLGTFDEHDEMPARTKRIDASIDAAQPKGRS